MKVNTKKYYNDTYQNYHGHINVTSAASNGAAASTTTNKEGKNNGQQQKKKGATPAKQQGSLASNRFFLPDDLEDKLHIGSNMKKKNVKNNSKKIHSSSSTVAASKNKKEVATNDDGSKSKKSFLSIMNSSESKPSSVKVSSTKKAVVGMAAIPQKNKKNKNKKKNSSCGGGIKKSTSSPPLNNGKTEVQKAVEKQDETDKASSTNHHDDEKQKEIKSSLKLLDLPEDVTTRAILPFLNHTDLLELAQVSKQARQLADDVSIWKNLFKSKFSKSTIQPVSSTEWKMAYRLSTTQPATTATTAPPVADNWKMATELSNSRLELKMRCFHRKKTFVEDVLGLGVDFTVNPVTKRVDYISVSQDLLCQTAFQKHKIRSDVFGNKFQLFLPLYFTKEHFRRALPTIKKTIVKLCPERKPATFQPDMVLDVFPKIITTFGVLLSDEGVSASQKSFDGLTRIHRLYLALAEEFPSIQKDALKRLHHFIRKEENRTKKVCPGLGQILPLLMIVDQKEFGWSRLRGAYLSEQFDRSVLWVCKEFPKLERLTGDGKNNNQVESKKQGEERVKLTLDAMRVPLRLTMFYVYFWKATCQDPVPERARKYDRLFFEHPSIKLAKDHCNNTAETMSSNHDGDSISSNPSSAGSNSNNGDKQQTTGVLFVQSKEANGLSFDHFREQTNYILSCETWHSFFHFVGLRCPVTKEDMAKLLRLHVKNSRRRKYHKSGMDFGRIHASGSSQILSKGQKFSASSDLKRVVFSDDWTFEAGTKYLDASCLLYKGKTLVGTVDYTNLSSQNGSVSHSGDVMTATTGSHTIDIDLDRLPKTVTSCVFVVSAWAGATLSDITSASISFRDADLPDDADPLCVYHLAAHDKIDHLTSVIMCKLYRAKNNNTWHVLAIGDAHKGYASQYKPIYDAVQKLL